MILTFLLIILLILSIIVLYFCNKIEKFENSEKKIIVVQADNRPEFPLLQLTRKVNEKYCNFLNYKYEFIKLDSKIYDENKYHPAVGKIFVINDLLLKNDINTIIIFLDSDAWVDNPHHLKDMIAKLKETNKSGCFSRDPYIHSNTYINSGSFIIVVNEFTRNMYKEIIKYVEDDESHHSDHPYDQYYISNTIYKYKDEFNIYIPPVLNTPTGSVLKHNWFKLNFNNYLQRKIDNEIKEKPAETLDLDKLLDDKIFPNVYEDERYHYHYDKWTDDTVSY